MTKWKVTVLMVTSNNTRVTVVDADYYKVEAGVLIFRNLQVNGYPVPVRTFAPSRWLEVKHG